MAFAQGQKVRWSSQSAGVTKVKEGTIEQVVPAGAYPDQKRFEQLYRGPGVGLARAHESYVVRVPGKTAKAAGKLYWPLVRNLQPA